MFLCISFVIVVNNVVVVYVMFCLFEIPNCPFKQMDIIIKMHCMFFFVFYLMRIFKESQRINPTFECDPSIFK